MKKLFLISINCTITDCWQYYNIETKSEINLTKAEAAYDIYSTKSILILEFTRQIISLVIVFLLDITYPIG